MRQLVEYDNKLIEQVEREKMIWNILRQSWKRSKKRLKR